ncbi:hypothetical protein JD292_06050 [Leucobacter sp. CSA2]|uniref:LGFP repeat-containing protein n=1 Tax=Leucobacter edaphi TaxID=2796472 RepID=A0A934QE73_9MICO|nr:hypothetical protein [Leucobacter edaphi]MBK0421632.1 hypothetical protein [Leucobacter edaphi]
MGKRGRSLLWVLTLALVAISSVGIALLSAPAAEAEAADNPSAGFNAGRIIDDSQFYDGNAMTATEIQNFLNQRVPRCTIGDPGRTAGMVWGNTRIAAQCLKNFRANTPSRAANAYCAAYAGASNESAAAILAKVSRACGISPRTLLVMLEKEQSLVTDTWPTVRQFDVAMGYACPDSGPNNSANCDPSQTGFVSQIYRAAWQLKVYKARINDYNYQPFKTNRIQWHPNAGCGTSNVYLENWATASLYIYTPYRPNQAALNAGWGTGDACSSYGNRNFYNFWTTWFGSPSGIPVNGAIKQVWDQFGGVNGSFGAPKAEAKYVAANGGGYVQEFTGGVILAENRTGKGAGLGNGPLLTAYREAGFVQGSWAWPVGNASCGLVGGGCTMPFQNGTVAYSAATGAKLIAKELVAEWNRAGGASGSYGYPTASAETVPGVGLVQQFQKTMLAWTPSGGARVFGAAYAQAWRDLGGVKAGIGLPVAGSVAVPQNGGGETLEFSRGTMYLSKAGIYGMESGAFREGYLKAGGPAGSWGWPAGKAACGLPGGGCYMPFQHGIGMWSSDTGMVLVSQASFDMWKVVNGSIGYPTKTPSKLSANGGGEVQEFTRGTVWSSPLGSYAMENGPFREGYVKTGGAAGPLGWPAGKASCSGSTCTMKFQKGIGEIKGGVFSIR